MKRNKDEILSALDEFVTQHNRLPKAADCVKANNLPSISVISQLFGKPLKLFRERYPNVYEREKAKKKKKFENIYKEIRCITDDEYRKEMLQKIDSFVEENKRLPKMEEFRVENGLPSRNTVVKYFGNIKELLAHRYPQFIEKEWDEKSIRKAVETFRIKHGRLPIIKDLTVANKLPTPYLFKKVCGDVKSVLKVWYPEFKTNSKKLTIDEIYSMIDRFVEQNGRMPVVGDYTTANGLPSYTTVRNKCGNNEMIAKERYPHLKTYRMQWTEKSIIEAFDNFIKRYNRLPSFKEMADNKDIPSASQVRKCVGDLYQFLKKRYNGYELPHKRVAKGYWDTENMVTAVKEYYEKHGRLPKVKELGLQNGLPSNPQFSKKFGGWKSFCRIYFPDEYQKQKKGSKQWDEEKILKAIDLFFKENGRLPKGVELKKEEIAGQHHTDNEMDVCEGMVVTM